MKAVKRTKPAMQAQLPLAVGIAPDLIRWQRRHGRHHLPWQRTQAEIARGAEDNSLANYPFPVSVRGQAVKRLSEPNRLAGMVRGAEPARLEGQTRVEEPTGVREPDGGAESSGHDTAEYNAAEKDTTEHGAVVDIDAARPLAKVLRDPYRVWLSEVMLQQTQVATVIPYFESFLKAFPSVMELAAADSDQVMGLWAGLGYYSRARNLHAAARQVAARGGEFPSNAQALESLPGVGRSTAAAIAVFGFGERAAILDGNVKRVLSRVMAIDADPSAGATLKTLWGHAEAELPATGASAADLIAYTQGLMDLGAMICTRSSPRCGECPLVSRCLAHASGEPQRYPAARARKAVPVRDVHLLLVRRKREVLLQVRPARGIWGGLWSLPELPQQPPADWVQAGAFEHVFTHFRMRAHIWQAPEGLTLPRLTARWPWLADVLPSSDERRWLALDALENAPLPAPVKSWLNQSVC